MIDDNEYKQDWFALILQRTNERAEERNLDVQFVSGFGDQGHKASVDAASLLSAVTTKGAIYLVDLGLNPQPTGFVVELREMVSDHVAQAALIDVRAFIDRRDQAAGVVEKHEVSAHILAYLKRAGKPYLFVSADVSGGDMGTIVGLGLASRENIEFPNERVGLYQPDAQRNFLNAWADRLLGLVDPWTRIQTATRLWFSKNIEAGWRSFEQDGLPHNFPRGAAEFEKAPVAEWEKCLSDVFPWLSHEGGWGASRAAIVHECLKSFAGVDAQWMSVSDDRARPLSLAGAYFVFLVALNQTAPGEVREPYLVKDWSGFFGEGGRYANDCIPFMRSQDTASAKRTLRCLYEFLRHVLRNKDGRLGCADFRPPSKGAPYFSVKLAWDEKDVTGLAAAMGKRAASFLDATEDSRMASCSDEEIFPAAKTAGAFLRFMIASQSSKEGFGATGTIGLAANKADPETVGWLRIGHWSGA